MRRESINPVSWGLPFKLDQGEIVEGISRYLHCSGQISVEPDADAEMGFVVRHAGDVRAQMDLALANVDAVLKEAGMDRSNVLSIKFYTTDVDGILENYDVYTDWIDEAGTRPPSCLLGVARLALPDLMIEIEVVAGA